ncbi:hypothetical protein Bca4012_058331 [Brassica carinata]
MDLLTAGCDDDEEGVQKMVCQIVKFGYVFAEVDQTRKNLPVVIMEQEIMEAINITPSSRSGLSVLQPHRVAFLATAKRVAHELGVRLGQEVRFQNDFSLSHYSVIILDEGHERSLNTDILIGMLTRVMKIRQEYFKDHPLKLILMSATLRVEDFVSEKRLFPKPPLVIEVPTRQYSVTIHFSKKTHEKVGYINEAYKKVMSIHKKLPQGGILVFVTGQIDFDKLCWKLRNSSKKLVVQAARRDVDDDFFGGVDMNEIAEAFNDDFNTQNYRFDSHGEDPYENDGDFDKDMYESDEESDWETVEEDGFTNSLVEDEKLDALLASFKALADKKGSESTELTKCNEAEDQEERKPFTRGKLCVLPLYAMLSSAAQL